MKRTWKLSALVLAVSLVLSGCGPAAKPDPTAAGTSEPDGESIFTAGTY